MGWIIGRGIGIPFRLGGSGLGKSSYWLTREPSGLLATPTDTSAMIVTWTDAAQSADGLRVYISTDNITFTLADTVAFGVQTSSLTGLTEGTMYYVSLVAYKGVNESNAITDTALTFTTEYKAVYDEFIGTLPNKSTQQKGTQLFLDIDSILTKLEFLFTFAHSTNESGDDLINWLSPATRATLGGTAATHEIMLGLTPNGVDGYIKTGIIPSNLSKMTAENASIGCYISKVGSIVDQATFGALTNTNRFIYGVFVDGIQRYSKLNENSNFAAMSYAKNTGTYSLTRNVTTKEFSFNGVQVKTAITATTGLPTKEIYIGAYNSDGTATGFSNDRVAFFYGGQYLTSAELETLSTAFENYLSGSALIEKFDSLSRNSITVEGVNNPEGELVFDYNYSHFKLSANPSIYAGGSTVAHIAVFVDNVYNQKIDFTAAAEKDVYVTGEGTKRITLVEGMTSKPDATVLGTFITGLKCGSSYSKVTETTVDEKLIFIGDSIALGGTATVPASEGFPALFRSTNNKSVAMLGYGYGTMSGFAGNAGLVATTVGYFQTLFTSTTTKKIVINLGTNDHGLLSLAAATFQSYYEALLSAIHVLDANIQIYCLSPILRGDALENATLDDYRTRIGTICSARASYCTYISGKTILTYPDDYVDILHPNTGGHLKIYTALNTVIYP